MHLFRCPPVPQSFGKIVMIGCITVLSLTYSPRTPVSLFLSSVYNMFLWCPLQWLHNGRDSVSNHQRFDCILNRLFRPGSKNTSKLGVTGLCEGIHQWPVNSPHKGPVTQKMFPFDDAIMRNRTVLFERANWHQNLLQRLPCGEMGCYSEMSCQFACSSKTSEAHRVV